LAALKLHKLEPEIIFPNFILPFSFASIVKLLNYLRYLLPLILCFRSPHENKGHVEEFFYSNPWSLWRPKTNNVC